MIGFATSGPAPAIVAVPPEFATEAALLTHLGLSAQELKKIWWYRSKMYHQFEVAKSNGKTRIINAPDKRLKYLQRQIAAKLDTLYPVRNPVHGFVAGKSVKTNAEAHLRKRFVLNIDLKDFFQSITEPRVVGVLRSLGIIPGVADIIARICCYNLYLPQGAPTSPVLSNMICFRLDKQLLSFAKQTRCIYTRYADDITFSSHQAMGALFEGAAPPSGRFSPTLLAPLLRDAIVSNGFAVNADKAHYADRHSRRMVTGLKVNELLNVDRSYVRNIRAALHSVTTIGLTAAEAKFKSDHSGKSPLRAHLQGKIAWLGNVRGQSDPVFRALAIRFNENFPANKIVLAPTPQEIRDRAVWIVEHEKTQGTAFFAKGIGLLTAAHCVKGVDDVELYHPSKYANKFAGKVIWRDEDRDLAIIKHSIPTNEFYELVVSDKAVQVGDKSRAVGYPEFGPGDGINVRDGQVSSLTIKHAVKLIEVTQKLAQGMSGGPLLDSDNLVVGIIHKGGPGEPRDFAIHAEVLNEWLAGLTFKVRQRLLETIKLMSKG